MSIEDIIKEDSSFSESAFIAKVDNTFIMLLTAIMTDNMPRVEHKISDVLYQKYKGIVDDLNKQNKRQMYDELNVKSTNITDINITEDKYIINVLLTSRYMDYRVDKISGNFVDGENTMRIEKDNYLTFEKIRNGKSEGAAKKCPGCGANIDANNTGVCSYCGAIYNTKDYDWILTDLK